MPSKKCLIALSRARRCIRCCTPDPTWMDCGRRGNIGQQSAAMRTIVGCRSSAVQMEDKTLTEKLRLLYLGVLATNLAGWSWLRRHQGSAHVHTMAPGIRFADELANFATRPRDYSKVD